MNANPSAFTDMSLPIKEFVSLLNPFDKDKLYRCLWEDYVREDVQNRIEDTADDYQDIPEDDMPDIIDTVVYKYVRDGDYDCNRTYWENIDNLIEKVIEEKGLSNGGN